MKANIYAKIEISPSSGYVIVEDAILAEHIEDAHARSIDIAREFGGSKAENIDGFIRRYVELTVEYDGRKRNFSDEDVLRAMERRGLAKRAGESMFGGFYEALDGLRELLDQQLKERHELARNGHYVRLEPARSEAQ